jgi:hypothetical protein
MSAPHCSCETVRLVLLQIGNGLSLTEKLPKLMVLDTLDARSVVLSVQLLYAVVALDHGANCSVTVFAHAPLVSVPSTVI